jgi:two-component system, NarL family, sensor histidine kinase UhpB
MLRSYRYVLVILAAITPLVVLGIATDAFLVYQKRETMRQEVIGRVRPMMSAVDTALAASEAALRTLAASKALQAGDLRAFHEESRRFLATQPHLGNVSLASVEGENLAEAIWPFGTRARVYTDLPSFYMAAKEGVTTYGNIAIGPALGSAAVRMRLPVIHEGAVRYVISAPHRLDWFEGILRAQNPPADWIVVLLDGNRHFIARLPPVTPSSASLQAALEIEPDGAFSARTIDGVATYATAVTSARTGWTLAVAIPQREIDDPAWRIFWGLIAGTVIALAIALPLLLYIMRRIERRYRRVS